MKQIIAAAGRAIGERWFLWTGIALGFVLAYNLMLLAALIVRFGELPNYAMLYDYPANVLRIVASTPSLTDALQIVGDEWLIEIGYMNRRFGNGISEWSLTVLPSKLFVLLAVGALLATAVVLVLPGKAASCVLPSKAKALGAAGGGVALVGFSSATLSWVVCCAAPTWVVSLAMLGMSVPLALWLQPFGQVITVSGFALLLATVVFLARRQAAPATSTERPGLAVPGNASAVSPG